MIVWPRRLLLLYLENQKFVVILQLKLNPKN